MTAEVEALGFFQDTIQQKVNVLFKMKNTILWTYVTL